MVTRYEDLTAWKKACALTREVYVATRGPGFARDFGLSGQAQRSAVSIMANIAEGFERRRDAEFLHFLDIAKASAAELGSHLYVGLDVGYLDQPDFDRLLAQTQEVGRLIAGLRDSVQRMPPPGPRRSSPGTGSDSGLGTRDSGLP